jgi:hypothetical protein
MNAIRKLIDADPWLRPGHRFEHQWVENPPQTEMICGVCGTTVPVGLLLNLSRPAMKRILHQRCLVRVVRSRLVGGAGTGDI